MSSWPDLDQNADGGSEDEDYRSGEDDDEHNEEDVEDRDSLFSALRSVFSRSPPPQEQSPGGASSSSDSSGFIPPPRTRDQEQPGVVASTSNNPPTVPTSRPETTNTTLAHFPGQSRVLAAHMMDPGAGVQQQSQPWTGAQPSNVQNIVPRNCQGHGAASNGGQQQMSGPGEMVDWDVES